MDTNNIAYKRGVALTTLFASLFTILLGVLLSLIVDMDKGGARKYLSTILHTTESRAIWGIVICVALLGGFFTLLTFYYESRKEAKEVANKSYMPTIFTPYNCFLRLLFRCAPFLDIKKAYFAPLIQERNKKKYLQEKEQLEFTLDKDNYLLPIAFEVLGYENDLLNKAILEKMGKVKPKAAKKLKERKNLLALFEDGFLQTYAPILILADSGLGKTAFLQKLYCNYAQKYPALSLAFVYANASEIGEEYREITDEITEIDPTGKQITKTIRTQEKVFVKKSVVLKQIQDIPHPEDTILFLDAFDEDIAARENFSEQVKKINPLLCCFRQVIITCRQQFLLPKEGDTTGIKWTEIEKDSPFFIVEMKPFTQEQVNEYIDKKYAKEPKNAAEAKRIVKQAKHKEGDSFFRSPLLLTYIADFLGNTQVKTAYLCDIYRHIIEKDANRNQLEERIDLNYYPILLQYSRKIAKAEHENNTKTHTYAEIETLAMEIEKMKPIDAQSRSFLTREPNEAYFKFSHQSFFDYFLALSLFEGEIAEEDFPFGKYPETQKFYNEMCWLYHARADSTQKTFDLGDKKAFTEAYPKLHFIPNRAICAMMIGHKTELEKAQFVYWHEIIAFLRTHAGSVSPFLPIFQDYEDALAEKESKRPYFQHFRREMAYSIVLKKWGTLRENSLTLSVTNRSEYQVIMGNESFDTLLHKLLESPNDAFFDLYQSYLHLSFQHLEIQHLNFCENLSRDLQSLDLLGNPCTDIKPIWDFRKLQTLHLPKSAVAAEGQLRAIVEMPNLKHLYLDEEEQLLAVLRKQLIFPPNMVAVKGGKFMMGMSPEDTDAATTLEDGTTLLSRASPLREVEVKPFCIGKYAVTVGEFRLFAEENANQLAKEAKTWNMKTGKYESNSQITWKHGSNLELQTEDRQPVVHVSWEDAVLYCNWLSEKTGKEKVYNIENNFAIIPQANGYRLPSEAEWEYAARGGQNFKYAGSDTIEEVAWYWQNSGDKPFSGKWKSADIVANNGRTHPVGQKKANGYGLYDMSGNVWEWCGDEWHENYDFAPLDGSAWIEQNSDNTKNEGVSRVLRGGSWYFLAEYCSVSTRNLNPQSSRIHSLGFRLVVLLS